MTFFGDLNPHQNDLTMKIREGNQRQGFAVLSLSIIASLNWLKGTYSMTTGDFHQSKGHVRTSCFPKD
jgi:hypothetical protein